MPEQIVITGIGMVSPLGSNPREVLRSVEQKTSAVHPSGYPAGLFACPARASITDFQAQPFVSEAKTVRLMNRDAQLAVAAARLALRDANLCVGRDYLAHEIGLYGATGLAGLPLGEIAPLIRASSASDGQFDLTRFGKAGLKAVSPILSFKILGNMPVCFVAINEGIKGPNAIFTPWEGQGAQAIECGVRALGMGTARCAVVGGCDVKTHELSFRSLEQQGVFESWRTTGCGTVPGEGGAFLVLECEEAALARGARIYARIAGMGLRSHRKGLDRAAVYCDTLKLLAAEGCNFRTIVSSADGDPARQKDEDAAFSGLRVASDSMLMPKRYAGDLFAAAAFVQLAIAAQATYDLGGRALVNCFGHGSEQAAFVLEES